MQRISGPPDKRLVRRLLKSALPVPLMRELKFEFDMVIVRTKQRRLRKKFAGRRDLKVNIGCGDNGRAGWVNIDGFQAPGVDGLVDLRVALPFDDQSVKAIFCEHVFEHLRYESDVPHFLMECRRILAPGGLLRIIVPDAGRYLHAYVEGGWETISKLRPLDADHKDRWVTVCWETKMELINQIFRQDGVHKFAWDAETLRMTLKRYFSNVNQVQFGQSGMPELVLDLEARASESLYMEAGY